MIFKTIAVFLFCCALHSAKTNQSSPEFGKALKIFDEARAANKIAIPHPEFVYTDQLYLDNNPKLIKGLVIPQNRWNQSTNFQPIIRGDETLIFVKFNPRRRGDKNSPLISLKMWKIESSIGEKKINYFLLPKTGNSNIFLIVLNCSNGAPVYFNNFLMDIRKSPSYYSDLEPMMDLSCPAIPDDFIEGLLHSDDAKNELNEPFSQEAIDDACEHLKELISRD